MRTTLVSFWLVAALVVGLFFACTGFGTTEWGGSDPADLYYNLLVRGFRAGHLALAKEAPAGLVALRDPYDPAANAPYRAAPYFLQDASYYRGKLYLYFGITPALVLFWPWVLLTGHYLSHKYAVAFFCSVGFLAGALLWRAIWRRYFPLVSGAVMIAGVLALGLAASTTILLQRPGICEVPISCAYACFMLALGFLWNAGHQRGRRLRWLAAASLAYGLAVGARPSDLFGAALLLIPPWLAWRESRRIPWRLAAAAVVPLALCGCGLMAYNALRFGSPFDFGHAYQLSDVGVAPGFNPAFIGLNLRFYGLAPTYWGPLFPFAQGIRLPALPPGFYPPDGIFGILPNMPVVLLAFIAPVALRDRTRPDHLRLGALLAALALLFGCILAPLLCYFAACGRYEAEFLPPLILLAGIGIFAGERAWPHRLAFRAVWIPLLVFSIGFNLLASCGRYAAEHYSQGVALEQGGQHEAAAAKLAAALAVSPGFLQAHLALGRVWLELGRTEDAVAQYRASVALAPASAQVHALLGNALDAAQHLEPAMREYEAALRLDPGDAATRNSLGVAYGRLGRLPEAAAQFEAAVALQPGWAEAHANLGNALFLMRRWPEAVAQYEASLALAPGDDGLRARLAAARAAEFSSR
jgi:tetratricopeptide (TPR) repeat protein